MKLVPQQLLALTVLLGALTVPSFTQDEDPPKPPRTLLSASFFHDKQESGGNECPNAGDGCVILVFSDGSVVAKDV